MFAVCTRRFILLRSGDTTTGTVNESIRARFLPYYTDSGSNYLFAGICALPATISSKAVKPKQRVSFDVMTSLNGEEPVNTEMLL